MKLTLQQGLDIPETEIIIRCSTVDERLAKLIDSIRQYSFSLEGKYEGASYLVPLEKILYIDSVDGRSFFYTAHQVYETKETLAALESKLINTSFFRISKNCILNLSNLKCVSPLWNHRMEATLKSGEKLIITRNYISALKDKLSKEGTL